MFRSSSAGASVDDLLDDLPAGYAVLSVAAGRLVVGPTGVFLVAEAVGDPPVAPTDLGRLAAYHREILAEQLGAAPFIDTLVVVPDRWRDHPVPGASAVSVRLLRDTVVSGPVLLAAGEVERIARVLRAAPSTALDRSG